MPKKHLPAKGEAISTAKARGPDAKLLRLEAEFNAASDHELRAADKVDKIQARIDRIRKRMRKAERKLDRLTQKGSWLFEKIIATRAKSVEGILAKVRVRKRWNTDDESSERAVLKSLVQDLERLAGAPRS